jgi:hypothetical protein
LKCLTHIPNSFPSHSSQYGQLILPVETYFPVKLSNPFWFALSKNSLFISMPIGFKPIRSATKYSFQIKFSTLWEETPTLLLR